MDLFNATMVKSPFYKLIIYLNEYEEELLMNNEELQFLLRNIRTNFNKLMYSVSMIETFQNNYITYKKDLETILAVQSIEYLFNKICTIWDISEQIYAILMLDTDRKYKSRERYKILKSRFLEYKSNFKNLNLDWYDNLNKIRNRITHGGINIVPLIIPEGNSQARLMFQVNDINVDDLIVRNVFYSSRDNESHNVNYYFCYNTHCLYAYLLDFFEFILLEISNIKQIDLTNLKLSDDLFDIFHNMHCYMALRNVPIFVNITNRMVHYSIHPYKLYSEDDEENLQFIKYFYNKYPFSFMNNIGDKLYEPVDNKDLPFDSNLP